MITSTGPHWFSHRRLLTPAFHYSILEDFCVTFGENSFNLIEELKQLPKDKEFDVYPHITKTALDIICGKCLKVSIKYLKITNQINYRNCDGYKITNIA